MGLATIDPHSQKEHTEIHKIPKFAVFSIFPFIMFVGYMFCYCAGLKPNGATKFLLAVTFILSILGIIFAGISINDFSDRCRPYN